MKRALVLVLVLTAAVAAALSAQNISGNWTFDVELDALAGDTTDYFDFTSSVTVTYELDGLEFTSVSTINDAGWVDQSFSAAGTVAAFDISSGLDLSTDGAFEGWDARVTFPFAALDIAFAFELSDSDVALDIGVSGETEMLMLDLTIAFGGDDNDVCDLPWSGAEIGVVGMPFCCAELDASLEISCGGFESACFSVSGIAVPHLPWLTLDAQVCFYVQTDAPKKQLTLTPVFDFGADVCFDVYIDQIEDGGVGPDSALVLGDIVVSGIGFSCEIGGVSFVGQSYFGDGSKPSLLSGTDYWEAYQISTADEACCGQLEFSMSIYYAEDSPDLFDIAGFSSSVSYDLGDNLTFNIAHDFSDLAPGVDLWTFGFEVTW